MVIIMESEQKKQEILDLAYSMINGKINLVLGSRLMNRLRFEADEDENSIFNTFDGVDSDTERFIFGKTRELHSSEYLQQTDKELAEYLQDMRPYIIDACKHVIDYFSDQSK